MARSIQSDSDFCLGCCIYWLNNAKFQSNALKKTFDKCKLWDHWPLKVLWRFPDKKEVLVGLGQTADGFTSEVEVIDLNDPTTSRSLPNFPYSAAGAISLDFGHMFCGGHNSTNYFSDCHDMDEMGNWFPAPALSRERWNFQLLLAFKVSDRYSGCFTWKGKLQH